MFFFEQVAQQSFILGLRYCGDISEGTDLIVDLTSYDYVCWGTRSSPSQMPTALLTTALIVWLDYYSTDGISNLDGSLRDNCHSSAYITHNGAQYKVYTRNGTSIY